MSNEVIQLEIKKVLKKLGINSQQKLNNFVEVNPDLIELNISVNITVNDENLLDFKDKVNLNK